MDEASSKSSQEKQPDAAVNPSVELPPSREEQITPATTSRKRQVDSDSDSDEPQLKRARLTRKNLALFGRMGRKKAPDSTDESRTTKTTSTAASGFAIQARKNGILDPRSSKPPQNLEDIRERHARPRATASPPESAYNDYVDRVERAKNEATMVVETSGKLLKEYPKGYDRVFNQACTGFPKGAGFNSGLSAPQPDFVEGLEMEEYDPFPVDEHVSGAALYKDDPHSLILPHLAGEWKGPGKDMTEAELQSAYDGAALVHARSQALNCVGKPYLGGHAKVTTFATDGTNLNLYAHYATTAEDGTFRYHQYPISSTNLKNSFDEFKKARRQLRNAQDDAREESHELRDQLKDYWKQHHNSHQPIAEGAPLPTPDLEPLVATNAYEETAPYENEASYEIVEQPCQLTPAASSRMRKASRSNSSTESHPSSHVPSNGGHKRKASSSQGSSRRESKYRSYWKKDAESGHYYHKHSDGRISWLDDDEGY
ncbi:hypothetical protein MKZ38_006002 [Zalerion maritima]|uniref:DUF7924 domain-containing protein n=1 Tax=Zalerion maritima TaxID=339359 RepID=A0AAD5WQ06_9PEZI|nr:hypothetical protein MKZ38_006002 [Zalerion maritima]